MSHLFLFDDWDRVTPDDLVLFGHVKDEECDGQDHSDDNVSLRKHLPCACKKDCEKPRTE